MKAYLVRERFFGRRYLGGRDDDRHLGWTDCQHRAKRLTWIDAQAWAKRLGGVVVSIKMRTTPSEKEET